ncbi:MAG: glycosyltransferase family 39 protein [Bacteroidales bacterium]
MALSLPGVFILPDTPQLFFWLLSIYFITKSIFSQEMNSKASKNLIWFGVLTGLGMLSKYTSVYIWVGLVSYIFIYDRRWLKDKALYISVIVSIILFSPVIWWNIQNDFISFSFQSERVNVLSSSIRFDFFLMEILGEFLYNNPVNVVIIIFALYAFIKKKSKMNKEAVRLLLLISLPLIFTFILFSFFRRTLPHWTAPAFTTLLIVAAAYIADRSKQAHSGFFIPGQIKAALYVLSFIIIIGFLQIKVGIIEFYDPEKSNPAELGEKDISLDIVGWKQIGREFSLILKRDLIEGKIDQQPFLTTYRWFPAANLDYYAATPNNIQMLAIGPIQDIHKYYWINHYRSGFQLGSDAYYITTSRDFHDPKHVYARYFERIVPSDTIRVTRGGKHVMNAFVYRLKNMNKLPKY